MVSGSNKLPRNTKIFLFPVLYISNTFLRSLADPTNADFWIKLIDASTPIPFKLPFNRYDTGFHFPHSSQFSGQILILILIIMIMIMIMIMIIIIIIIIIIIHAYVALNFWFQLILQFN